jgi:hypothetical protein
LQQRNKLIEFRVVRVIVSLKMMIKKMKRTISFQCQASSHTLTHQSSSDNNPKRARTRFNITDLSKENKKDGKPLPLDLLSLACDQKFSQPASLKELSVLQDADDETEKWGKFCKPVPLPPPLPVIPPGCRLKSPLVYSRCHFQTS